jgi:hypothetical protein
MPKTAGDPYARFERLRGDLHIHATQSFDVDPKSQFCAGLTAHEQLEAARNAGLQFAALTEHEHDPTKTGISLGAAGWQQVLAVTAAETSAAFIALPGYEWTSSYRTPFQAERKQPDYDHKVVILPPGSPAYCGVVECPTPDSLSAFAQRAGGVIITPHPWEYKIPSTHETLEKDYFKYQGDGSGDTIVGAEVEPDFLPMQWDPTGQGRAVTSQTVTIDEWIHAAQTGKHVGAIGSSDSHGKCAPEGRRSTLLFVTERTAKGIFEALRSRRTMSAHLAPFDLRLSTDDGTIVGGTARAAREAVVSLSQADGDALLLEVFVGAEAVASWSGAAANGEHRVAIDRAGPLWARVSNAEKEPDVGTQRMTITSPIWLVSKR